MDGSVEHELPFNPAFHSWILVDGLDSPGTSPAASDALLAQSWTVAADTSTDLDEATRSDSSDMGDSEEPPSLPLSQVALFSAAASSVDGDDFSTAALDELAAWIPLSRGMSPDEHGSDTPYGPLAPAPTAHDIYMTESPLDAASALDPEWLPPALALFLPASLRASSVDGLNEKGVLERDGGTGKADAPFEWVFRVRTSSWGKPLALAAAMFVSHAAVLFMGIALGKRTTSITVTSSQLGTNAWVACGALARRFSSGPYA